MKTKFLLGLLACSALSVASAKNITNQIRGVGPADGLVSPYFCIQDNSAVVKYALAPGASVDANQYSGNPNYAGGAIRFGGCDAAKNTYLGYAGVSGTKVDYTPPEGTHIVYSSPAVDSAGNMTGEIHYTPIKANFNLLNTPPRANSVWQFVGVNLSGLEFGKMIDPVVVPNLSAEDAASKMSDLADTQTFIKAGMNTMRVPLHWGYLQLDGPGKGEINREYYDSYVKPLLETLTSAHVYTIVDLHAYMRYSTFGKQYAGCGMDGACPDGTLITDANAYQDLWTKLLTLMQTDSNINMNYILFDLVNEPVNVPDDAVFTIQAQVIKSLRQHGYQGYILVEGNAWSGLHSWTTASWQSRDGKKTYTNATLFTRANFEQAGITDLSKIIINAHQYLDSDYSGTHDVCMTDLNTVGIDGYNLNAFTNYLQQNQLQAMVTEFGTGRDSGSCSVAMSRFLDYLKDNASKNQSGGFIGWTIWSTGHGWGDYNLRVTPDSYHMRVLQSYL